MKSSTSPRRQSTPKVAKLAQLADGRIIARSLSSRDFYRVQLGDAPSCECKGWQHYGRCYHVAQAAEQFAGFYTRRALPAVRRSRAADLYPDW